MEIRRSTICMALFVLAISQCSDAYSRHRRQATDEVNYDDLQLADEANDDETMNDTEQSGPQPEKIPAIIETTPTHYEVEAGVDVRLECKVTPEKGNVVAWHKDDDQYFMGNINLHQDDRYSIAEGSKDLIIRNTQGDDSGVFRCETVQKVPVAINHTLLVLQKPEIINMTATNDGIVGVGANLTVTCYVTASPVPTVLWSVTKKDQNERLTEKDAEFDVEGDVYSLHINNVAKENAGQYYCYALNKVGSHQAETSVVVNDKPQVHVPKTMVNSDIAIEAVLQCVAHGEARPHFRWYKDGDLIEDSATQYVISTHGAHSNLSVTPSFDGEFGTFTCEAENFYGAHNRSIELVQSPVVEDLHVDGPRLSWTVHSHQPVEAMEVQLKSNDALAEWTTFIVPVPENKLNKYDISYSLDDKQLQPGEYLAAVKVKNSKSWGGTEAAVIKIEDPQSLYIQTASVFRKSAAVSIRPAYTALSTILMYVLVRML